MMPPIFYAIHVPAVLPCGLTGSDMQTAAECGVAASQRDVAAILAEYEISDATITEVDLEAGRCRDVTADMLTAIARDACADATDATDLPWHLRAWWPADAEAEYGYLPDLTTKAA